MVLDPEEYGLDFSNDDNVSSFLSEAWKMVEDYLDSEDNDDYEINPPQFKKYLKTTAAIWDLIQDSGKKVESTRLVPKERAGGWTVSFNLLYLSWAEIYKFAESLFDICALSIDATTKGRVELSLNVPDVFRKKAGK